MTKKQAIRQLKEARRDEFLIRCSSKERLLAYDIAIVGLMTDPDDVMDYAFQGYNRIDNDDYEEAVIYREDDGCTRNWIIIDRDGLVEFFTNYSVSIFDNDQREEKELKTDKERVAIDRVKEILANGNWQS